MVDELNAVPPELINGSAPGDIRLQGNSVAAYTPENRHVIEFPAVIFTESRVSETVRSFPVVSLRCFSMETGEMIERIRRKPPVDRGHAVELAREGITDIPLCQVTAFARREGNHVIQVRFTGVEPEKLPGAGKG